MVRLLVSQPEQHSRVSQPVSVAQTGEIVGETVGDTDGGETVSDTVGETDGERHMELVK